MNKENNQSFDTAKLEAALAQIVRAFANSPEGGAFFLKYTLLASTQEHDKAIEDIYREILEHFQEQKRLAESVVSSLKYIRSCCLQSNSAAEYVKQQVDNIMHYKALLDYAKGTKSGPFIG